MNLMAWLVGRASAAGSALVLKLPNTIVNDTNSNSVARRLIDMALGFLALAAFIAVIYSAIMMITSSGDATKFAAGRKNLIWAIIGIVVVAVAYLIIRLVNSLAQDIVSSLILI